MRPYLLLNGEHVVEHDFSGMNIHILYAMKGMRLADTGLHPYKVSKDNDPEQKRPYYKKLLLAAINASSKWGCVQAVKEDKEKNPEDYPEGDYDLWQLLDEIIAYHPELEEFLLSEEGLRSHYVDSCIAYRVIKEMTDKGIPVLCIHDSFIAAEKHSDALLDCMKRAYVKELNLLLRRKGHDLTLGFNDAITDETTIIQRVTPRMSDVIRTLNRVSPSEWWLHRSASHQPESLGRPPYKVANRDKTTHLMRIDLTIEPHQKSRQARWLESNRVVTNFNETIKVSTVTIKGSDGNTTLTIKVSDGS
ncbi:hypothetical protein BVX95_01005 [archaeon D22]|nr:hypothetical protein BVX95_01005 [archaeon D22]